MDFGYGSPDDGNGSWLGGRSGRSGSSSTDDLGEVDMITSSEEPQVSLPFSQATVT